MRQRLAIHNPIAPGLQRINLNADRQKIRYCMRIKDYEGAIASWHRVIAATTQIWGPQHLKTVAALYELGGCHLKNHQPQLAQVHYAHAFEITSRNYPDMSATLQEIRIQIHIAQMVAACIGPEPQISHSEPSRSLNVKTLARMAFLADVSTFRGRNQSAERLYSACLAGSLRLLEQGTLEEKKKLYEVGFLLIQANRLQEAHQLLAKIVLACLSTYADCPTGDALHNALLDYSDCLQKMGLEHSTKQTRRLSFDVIKH
jgi:tetratricopeptide (TPR) repeat protein